MATPATGYASPMATISFDTFAAVELKVGTIVQAELHPNADKLLKLQVDLGEGTPRQICAGIKAWYSPEALIGRQVVVVVNLEPRVIRGEASNGMLLCASDEVDGQRRVTLLAPAAAVQAGSTVS
jgi:methionyl-tRNA synthetase